MKSLVAVGLIAATLAACNAGETFVRGQKITPDQLQQVPVGSSKEQVLLALGTPTTTGIADGEALYYISQTSSRSMAFQRPAVRDRRILVVYLDGQEEVREIAEYGLK
ncbi:MAG: outer membrane protein assembly factor BamE, partial [Pseudomonadota bacterium]